jgi:hypothetical protein
MAKRGRNGNRRCCHGLAYFKFFSIWRNIVLPSWAVRTMPK